MNNRKLKIILWIALIIIGLIPMSMKFLNPELDNSKMPYWLFWLVYLWLYLIFLSKYSSGKLKTDEMTKSIENASLALAFRIFAFILAIMVFLMWENIVNFNINAYQIFSSLFLLAMILSIFTHIWYQNNPHKI